MLLAIDTSTRNAAVALAENGEVIAAKSWRSMVNHSSELMPAVIELLQARDVSPASLDAVAVALGPGGFSALRTGMSVAKGLAITARIPIVGVGSLDLEAHPFRGAGMTVCALLAAGRGEASSALFAPGPDAERLREDRITGPDELLSELDSLVEQPVLFCGEGLAPWADAIESGLGRRAVLCRVPPSARAESLAELATVRLSQGEIDDLDQLQPNYLRMPTIGTPKRRDRRRQASSGARPRSRRGA